MKFVDITSNHIDIKTAIYDGFLHLLAVSWEREGS